MIEPLERVKAALAGRYQIERELGRGGNAVVYLAHDKKHDRKVALKVLQSEISESVKAERFLREIQIAARLAHPRIIAIHDSGEMNGSLYYVMPYVEGDTLRNRLDREHQLSIEEATRSTREVAEALAYAHGQGVVRGGNAVVNLAHDIRHDTLCVGW
jgi:serine/threonine-protein kinase